MQRFRGLVAGFVAGAACAAGAILLMREPAVGSPVPDAGGLAELSEQVRRLEQTVSKLSLLVAARTAGASAGAAESTASAREDAAVVARAAQPSEAVAAADALVDRGLQSGQWTRAQAAELHQALAEVDASEGARILARISAAINRDELRVELP